MKLNEFVQRLSDLLGIDNYSASDMSLNGLQVGDIDSEVRKVAFSVDASLATIKKAASQGADVLFVHHGLFWGRPIAITGRHYARVKALLDNNLALFACHLPLDAHIEYGNNAQMARKLGLEDVLPFAYFRGTPVGCKGSFPEPLDADQIIDKLGVRTNETNFAINCEGRKFKTVGIVSGEGAGDVFQAMDENLDLLITGESRYTVVNDCLESGIGMLCLGHYETETFGVKAIQKLVEKEYGLSTCFVDIPLGL